MFHVTQRFILSILVLVFLISTVEAAPAFNRQTVQQQINGLRQKISTLESKTAQLTQINNKLNKILQVLLINGSTVTLKSSGKLKLESATATSIKAGTSLKTEAGATQEMKGSTVKIIAGGATTIKGSIIKLNNGGKAIARIGSSISGNKVITGSPTVFVP